ncbi:MAG TPA: DUF1802 family protein [Tepidisphaeraceae bacterium]|jgi:hypothetical protein
MLAEKTLNTGLKEWAAVCHALETGRQLILFRKGGIHESAGEFELDHREFLLFPTYLHQKLEMIQPAERAEVEENHSEPATVQISAAAEVTDIRQLKERGQLDALQHEHIWMPALLDTRWNYRPENPLYLLILRVYRLAEPKIIKNSLEYAGCKSWVPLKERIEVVGTTTVASEEEFEERRKKILRVA